MNRQNVVKRLTSTEESSWMSQIDWSKDRKTQNTKKPYFFGCLKNIRCTFCTFQRLSNHLHCISVNHSLISLPHTCYSTFIFNLEDNSLTWNCSVYKCALSHICQYLKAVRPKCYLSVSVKCIWGWIIFIKQVCFVSWRHKNTHTFNGNLSAYNVL